MSSLSEIRPGVPVSTEQSLQETQDPANLSLWVAWKNRYKERMENEGIYLDDERLKPIQPLIFSFFLMRRKYQLAKAIDHDEVKKFWNIADKEFPLLIENVFGIVDFMTGNIPVDQPTFGRR